MRSQNIKSLNQNGKISMNEMNQIFSNYTTDVYSICNELFDETNISYYDYQRWYDDGTVLILTTHPEYMTAYIKHAFYPTLHELNLFTPIAKFTFMSDAMTLPVVADKNPKKYLSNILMAKEFQIHHRLYHVARHNNYVRICGFGITNDTRSIFEFYLNSADYLERYIMYFENQARELIEGKNKKTIILSKYYDKPKEIIEYNDMNSFNTYKLGFSDKKIKLHVDGELIHITPREFQTLELTLKGLSSKEAAKILGISNRTIEKHFENVKAKLGNRPKNEIRKILTSHGVIK